MILRTFRYGAKTSKPSPHLPEGGVGDLQVEAVGVALGEADHRDDQLSDLVAVGGYRQLVEEGVEAGVELGVARAGPTAMARLARAVAAPWPWPWAGRARLGEVGRLSATGSEEGVIGHVKSPGSSVRCRPATGCGPPGRGLRGGPRRRRVPPSLGAWPPRPP